MTDQNAPSTPDDSTPETTTASGEIWFKAQRVLRTAVQAIVSITAVLAVFVVVAPQVLDAVADVLPASWVAWAGGLIAGAGALSAALSRVMAIPAVDAWLKTLGLGSAPRSAGIASVESDDLTP